MAIMPAYPRRMASALDGLTDGRRATVIDRGAALHGLTDAQRDAVTHTGSALLVIGGPGTGKTEVLVRRLVWFADGGLPPHRTLVLSTQEGLRERVELALERPHEDLAVHTVAELCVLLLGAEARAGRHRPVRRGARSRAATRDAARPR